MMQAFHFASAKGGEMYVSGCDAESYERALDKALAMTREHFGMDCSLDDVEGNLGGFQLWAPSTFEYI